MLAGAESCSPVTELYSLTEHGPAVRGLGHWVEETLALPSLLWQSCEEAGRHSRSVMVIWQCSDRGVWSQKH
jgi:hypothetical protein